MRIMIDTNVILSALLFPSTKMDRVMEIIAVRNTMVLSSYVIEELYTVINRKFPTKVKVIDELLSKMSYELVYTPKNIVSNIEIRDEKDLPIIYTALVEGIDILVTGDKDFAELKFDSLEILTPAEFLDSHG